MKLRKVPIGGVLTSTPEGHYLDLRSEKAQIITVGKYRGRQAYRKVMPGWKIVSVEIMDVPDAPHLEGRFTSVLLDREYAT